jgi:hemerythrin-like domain-containing protein
MQATAVLKAEHDVIERVLTMLEFAVVRLHEKRTVPEGFPAWSLEFFRHFADHCHHGKEEDILFPLLQERGIPVEGGPIGVMLAEHERGRDCVRRMESAVARGSKGDEDFCTAASEYACLLRQHIFKENNVLFPMADNCLNSSDDDMVLKSYQNTECELNHREVHDRFVAEVAEWEAAFAKLDS